MLLTNQYRLEKAWTKRTPRVGECLAFTAQHLYSLLMMTCHLQGSAEAPHCDASIARITDASVERRHHQVSVGDIS